MRKFLIALALIAAACSGGDADTTTAATTAPTTTIAPATTTSSSVAETTTTTSTSTTVPATLPPDFATFTHPMFTVSYPEAWSENPEFPGFGAGFIEDHSALALPATNFSISLEEQEAGFDLDEHLQRIKDDLDFFVPNFRVLREGEEPLDGARSLWFEYSEEFEGFQLVIREQVALRDDLLVTVTLISPVEFFDFDLENALQSIASFTFS